jgi:hypothetical protein
MQPFRGPGSACAARVRVDFRAAGWLDETGVDDVGGCLRVSVGFERLEAGADESDHVVDGRHCLF